MKRRGISLILALVLLASLAACGSKQDAAENAETKEDIEVASPEQEDGTGEPDGADSGDGTIATEIIDVDDLETEDPAPEIGSRPADLEEKTEGGNLPADTNQKPVGQPVQKPVENIPADSQSRPAPSVDLAAFYESLTADSDLPAMTRAEGEILDSFYPGLSEIATNQCGVYTAMISAAVSEIALVEVQNADDVQKVKDIFQARIDYQVGDGSSPGGAWYPDTIEGWKTGSRIVSNGNYVMLVATYEKSDGIAAAFQALFA